MDSNVLAVIVVMDSPLSVVYLRLSWLYKWKPTALKSYHDTTHSQSCQAEHEGHMNPSIAVFIHLFKLEVFSFQHKHTHGFGRTTQDLGKGK